MPRLTKAEQAAMIDQEISRAETGTGELQDNRAQALDYIYGRPRGDELDGRSQVVSTDVADMIHAVMSQIMPGLAGTDFPASLMPDGPDDDEQAMAESLAISRILMQDNKGYKLLYDMCWNALALKNGWAKVWAEDEKIVQSREFEDATPADMQEAAAQEVPEDVTLEIDGPTLRRITTRKMIRIASVAPENMLYPQDAESIDDARFIAERKIFMRGELLEMGFSRTKVERIPPFTVTFRNSDTTARKVGQIQDPAQTSQKAQDKVEVFEVYMRVDVNGDGIPQLMRYLFAGAEILESMEVDFIPYATGSPWPIPSRLTGRSMFDALKGVQDIGTALWRSVLDNFSASNFQEAVVNDRVNVDDMLNRRPGGINRVDGEAPVQDAVMGMPIIPQVDAGLALMEHLKGVRAERGGAALEMAAGEMQLFESQVGSQGLDRSMSVQESMSGMLARNLAESLVKELYLLTHMVVRNKLDRPIQVLMAGQWQTVDPMNFRPRNDVSLKAGLTQGERSRKMGAMQQIMQLQMTAIQGGMDDVLVDLNNVHTAIIDFARGQGIDSPERYFIDPQSPEAQQALQGKAESAEQQTQQSQQLAQAPFLIDKANKDAELSFKYWAERLKSEVKEAEIAAEQLGALHLAELNQAQAQGQAAGSQAGNGGRPGQNGTGA